MVAAISCYGKGQMNMVTADQLKQDWLTALRSGEYEQGEGRLRTMVGEYCCIGVLADILVKKGIGEWFMYGFRYNNITRLNELSHLRILHCTIQEILIRQNDVDKKNFKEIADYIEENVTLDTKFLNTGKY